MRILGDMMRIVVDINHPADVHCFKNFIWEMEKRGHEILITASNKEVSYSLLDNYGFPYVKLGSYGTSLLEKMVNIPLLDIRMYRKVKKFKPDIFLGFGSIRAAHVSFLLKKPCINLEDTEHSTGQIRLYLPFVKVVCTPSCYSQNLGKKQIRFNGYLELASLHPHYFTPDPAVLREIGLKEGDPFIIVRFVAWRASHDIGQHGITDKVTFVKELEKYGRVLITSEETLSDELKAYQIRVSPEKVHNLLYYATLYVGEGATMATEAALLGTPSILISSLVGTMGNFIELEEKYDLIYSFPDPEAALQKALDILQDPSSKEIWAGKRERVLKEKIDVTTFLVRFIENYPQSFIEMKNHQDAGKNQ